MFNKIYTDIYKVYGEEYQLQLAIEEMSELTKEISKYNRNRIKVNQGYLETIDNKVFETMSEEIADVEITITQLKAFYSLQEKVNHYKASKLLRLKNVIDKYEVKKNE